MTLLDNGYAPLPIRTGEKRPAATRWSRVRIDENQVETWARQFPDHGVGLRTGTLVGLDIDVLDPDRAHVAQALAMARLGDTLVRVGRWPKRLLLYRSAEPFRKLKAGQVEFLGLGQQFVAFGRHPGTGAQYYWSGETPLDVCRDDLPEIDAGRASAFLAEIEPADPSGRSSRGGPRSRPAGGAGPVRDDAGRVIDGRDCWLSGIAFHAVHDALDAGDDLDAVRIATVVWNRFCETADIGRPRQDSGRPYGFDDAVGKVHDKLRLASKDRLPPRERDTPEPEFDLPVLGVEEGRERLSTLLDGFADRVLGWHRGMADRPMLGIRATVGLGKSRLARDRIVVLAETLRADGLPHRVLVFTPSHSLAEEAAAAWRAAGADAVVMRGYERSDPVAGAPMCRDLDAVRAALASGLPVQGAACHGKDGAVCRHYRDCPKQRNRDDVAAANVVVAAYDALFTGLAFEHDDVALLLIDEGCWPRAIERIDGLFVEDLAQEPLSGMGAGIPGYGPTGATADLADWRRTLSKALSANGPGPVTQAALLGAGLAARDCESAAKLERWRVRDPRLRPALTDEARRVAFRIAAANARIARLAGLWTAVGGILSTSAAVSGRLEIGQPDASGRHPIHLRTPKRMHESLRGKPVLHLDATMRAELVRTVLTGLEIETVEVAAPHMQIRHVAGSFGKSMLCPQPGLAPDEAARRSNRLRECVDYVRWHARRVVPSRVLVVTYKSIELAFAGIPNVEIAHFNAVAGLDAYRDVGLLVCIGRPLPSSEEIGALAGAYFDAVPSGGYGPVRAGIRMRGGSVRGIDVVRHRHQQAELLRAAICDDEVLQAVGRGRGVNRTAENPLEAHVLADVALPLEYDGLASWDALRPDIVQRMLLDGIAVDSPADATALHPALFSNGHQAKMAFERAAFKAQNPMSNPYREMCLKSAAYRRSGRGRSWQRAWWIERDELAVRAHLEAELGDLAEWQPCGLG